MCKWLNGDSHRFLTGDGTAVVNGDSHRFLTGDGTAGLIDLVALRMMISESE